MNRKISLAVITLLIFVASRYLKYFFALVIYDKETWSAMDVDLRASMLDYTQIILVLTIVALFFKQLPFKYLGLNNRLLEGAQYGFLFTLPMFLGYAFLADFQFDFSLKLLHRDLILAGFFEEFMFRGFAFGLLFYYCGWGFIPAVFVPSIFFGLGHLYQAETFSEGLSVFLFTALGSAGFAWFYVAWQSLWMVIFLHGFMDLAWDMFSIQSNVTGNLLVNVFRFTTLGLAIFYSVRKAKAENNYNLKDKLWVHKID